MTAQKDPSYPVDFFVQLFGLSARRVQQLANEGIIVKAGRGQYRLLASVRGYVTFLQERVSGDRKADGWRDERARLAREQADRIALENAVSRGRLIQSDQVENVLSAAMAALSADLDGLPGRMATTVAGIDDPAIARATLQDETRRIRRSFAQSVAELAELNGDPGPVSGNRKPAKKKKRKRVGGRKPKATGGVG